jgi:hypothetical protein
MVTIQVDGETISLFEFVYKVERDWLTPTSSIQTIVMWNLDKNKTVIGRNLPPNVTVELSPSYWGQLEDSRTLQPINNPKSYNYVVSTLLDAEDLIRIVKINDFFKIAGFFFPDPSAEAAFGKPVHFTVECKLNSGSNMVGWDKGSKIPVGLTQIVNFMEGLVAQVFPSSS